MTLFEAALLGLVEGITEFLPISSTAHLMFTSEALGLAQSTFVKSFEIAIQLGAILAVVVLYWRKFLELDTMLKVAVAFLPTAAIGLALYPVIKGMLIGNTEIALVALFVGGVFLIVFERWHGKQEKTEPRALTYKEALLVGTAQAIAVIPGVSRSAATIIGGLALGINRQSIVEFSFLLAAPTMAAATALDLYKNAGTFSSADWGVLGTGFVVSFIVAIIAIKWLLRFVQRHDFTGFGIYRIVAAVLFALLLLR